MYTEKLTEIVEAAQNHFGKMPNIQITEYYDDEFPGRANQEAICLTISFKKLKALLEDPKLEEMNLNYFMYIDDILLSIAKGFTSYTASEKYSFCDARPIDYTWCTTDETPEFEVNGEINW